MKESFRFWSSGGFLFLGIVWFSPFFFLSPASAQQQSSVTVTPKPDPNTPKSSFLSFLRKQPLTYCKAEEELKEQARIEASGKCVVGETVDKCRPNRETVIRDSALILDMLERHLEEWGHASFSEVVLIPDFKDTQDFGIDYPKTHNFEHYETQILKSKQGSARLTETIQNSIGVSAGIGQDAGTTTQINPPITFPASGIPFPTPNDLAATQAAISANTATITNLQSQIDQLKANRASGEHSTLGACRPFNFSFPECLLWLTRCPPDLFKLTEIHRCYCPLISVTGCPRMIWCILLSKRLIACP